MYSDAYFMHCTTNGRITPSKIFRYKSDFKINERIKFANKPTTENFLGSDVRDHLAHIIPLNILLR